MRNRIERLRIWLAGSAVFLVLVIAAFVGWARYLRHLRVELPAKLGINVVRETDGYTYSQNVKGKTVFELHAAKAVERTDGKVALHDVWVMLYGRSGDRHDRIYGDEFEYDHGAGLVRATGLVHMDLQAAGAAANAKTMHVTTSGLVYLEKLGVAATSEPIEFESGGMKGHATGADYSSDSGMLMLHSAVSMSGVERGQPVTVTAAAASLDRERQAFLTDAKYVSMGRTVTAQQATLHSRPDGTLARVEAQGNVTAQGNGATLAAQRGDVILNAKGEAESAVMTGGVTYALDGPLLQRKGKAQEGTISFDAQGQPQRAVFAGAVQMEERTRTAADAKALWSERNLTAAKVDAALAAGRDGKAELRDVDASGGAQLTMTYPGGGQTAKATTEIAADELKAHLLEGAGAKGMPGLDTLAGSGHTMLRQVSADGQEQMSAGDELTAKFRADAFAKSTGPKAQGAGVMPRGMQASKLLVSAVQQGHVTVMRRVPAKSGAVGSKSKSSADDSRSGADDVEHAVAEKAVYEGDPDRVTLTGGVVLRDGESALWAPEVELDHATGNATAEGGVKAEMVQGDAVEGDAAQRSAEEPMHVLASRADLDHASRVATFYGAPVRLWQGGSQVLAPVVEFAQSEKRLVAHGDAASAAGALPVHAVLAGGGGPGASGEGAGSVSAGCPAKAAGGDAASGRGPQLMRIASGVLTYSGVAREADFTGGLRAEGDGGTIRASGAAVYLQPVGVGSAGAKAGKTAEGNASADAASLSGKIDRMVVSGAVAIDEPGFHATGARLVYTASDQVFLLTGERSAPPRATDAQGRMTTGAALRFQSCGGGGAQNVEALGTAPGMPTQRVRTESRVEDEKKQTGKR